MLNFGVNDATRSVPYAELAMETQGQRLKRLREQKGWTLDQAAKLIGTTKGAISQWESDVVTNIRPENLLTLCEVYGTDPWYVVFGPDRKPPPSAPKNRRRAA